MSYLRRSALTLVDRTHDACLVTLRLTVCHGRHTVDMSSKRGGVVILGVLFSAFMTTSCATHEASSAPTAADRSISASPSATASTHANNSPAQAVRRGPFKVVRVADGDTLTVRIGAALEKVRVVGINTPESVDPRRPVQCFGREASDRAKSLLSGQSVWLERDITQGERDKYGRMLAFVWLDQDTDFGLKMIREGYAMEYTYKLAYRDQLIYRAAQQQAKSQRTGLWSPQTCAGDVNRPA